MSGQTEEEPRSVPLPETSKEEDKGSRMKAARKLLREIKL
jgi:hypothetical protein